MHRAKNVTYFKSARYTMKLAFRYFKDTRRIAFDPAPVFALKVPTHSNLLPAASLDDVAKVLDAIDRSTPVGKRDYAFLLIGATTGLRLADIAALRLKDVDWRGGTIDVVQRKTSVALSVPLVCGIGDALSDYILRGRGRSACGKCDEEALRGRFRQAHSRPMKSGTNASWRDSLPKTRQLTFLIIRKS